MWQQPQGPRWLALPAESAPTTIGGRVCAGRARGSADVLEARLLLQAAGLDGQGMGICWRAGSTPAAADRRVWAGRAGMARGSADVAYSMNLAPEHSRGCIQCSA